MEANAGVITTSAEAMALSATVVQWLVMVIANSIQI